MATKPEMLEEITELAKELGIELEEKERSSRELTDLLSDLRAKKRDADKDTEADKPDAVAEKKDDEEVELEKVESDSYVIAKGKSITSKKGILSAGETAKPEYFSDGAFDNLVEKSFIVKG